jgi:hypothetical protein
MDPLSHNPFAVLTFIVAPAVLTNACSVMGLQTANRFARTVDRARLLAAQFRGREAEDDPEVQVRLRQLNITERRALLLVRAMTAFYLAVGSFAGASFASLLGAVFVLTHLDFLLGFALLFGIMGVGGLVTGSGLLVWETRQALAVLYAETQWLCQARTRKHQPETPAPL